MNVFHRMATKLGLIKPEMPEILPHIAVYSLIILDRLVEKSANLSELMQSINDYPEDTHREGGG